MGRAARMVPRPWLLLLLLLAGASAEKCASAAAVEGSGAPAGDCGCSSLKRDAVLEKTRNRDGEESTPPDAKAPAAEGAAGHGGAAAKHGGTAAMDGAPAKLLLIPGGEFVMGHNDKSVSPSTFHVDGEGPARRVAVSDVWMGQTEVSNAQWAAFAEATGYESESEGFGWSFVFERELTPAANASATQSVTAAPWWVRVDGAYWRVPDGPGSDALASERATHPVVHMSWTDARSYCAWAYPSGRLPTEAEWEHAARGPETGRYRYPWGKALVPDGVHRANIFQGTFPRENSAEDGYRGAAPVTAFGPQNGHGLYNMIGNVWEWTADYWTATHEKPRKGAPPRQDPQGPPHGDERTKKGGSYMCHKSYCHRYRIAARSQNAEDTGTSNLGFRCAKPAAPPESTHDEL